MGWRGNQFFFRLEGAWVYISGLVWDFCSITYVNQFLLVGDIKLFFWGGGGSGGKKVKGLVERLWLGEV
jgi:hypothetical protein